MEHQGSDLIYSFVALGLHFDGGGHACASLSSSQSR
ncbi:BnaC01g21460D [Brassica napus]|uniref:(rape) hypothetical protein n=1 Tax=Brassica napus TaxID=3708 RepID=A0A078HDX1_BRANA|nr:unnamed protein product [Brassica napus]CDY35624.1 BnaC01g21460D [Brassica napus]